MKNLNQIRAAHVLEFSAWNSVKGKNGGEVIKKISPVIMNNGLLAALAYSMNDTAWKTVFDGVAIHLASSDIGLLPSDKSSAEMMLDYLAGEATSNELRDVTAETDAWLNFARRLVK